MRNTDTGEFELVMGNRQLLSGFFIVALLFGVAFAMGYIVGRNSSPSAKAQAEASGHPLSAEQRPAASGARVEAPPATAAEAPRTDTQAPPATVPDPGAAAPAAAAAEKPAEPAPAPAAAAEPAPGNYWQVMAVKQPEAEIVLRSLKEKGFPASLGQGPNNLTRVLVGPYGDRETLGKAKAELENAGFHPILKK
jgi:cell division septation protein DedD